MIPRQRVLVEARKWLGTPFVHQGRNAFGLDCVGLLIVVARGLGISDYDVSGYGRSPDPAFLRAECARLMHPVPVSARLPGDVLLFRYRAEPQHLAFVTGRGIIHSYYRGGVIETALPHTWAHRIVGAYTLPGVG